MGIEQFLSTIYQNQHFNPKHNKCYDEFKTKIPTTHLFMDFNSVIHDSSGILLGKIHKLQKEYIKEANPQLLQDFNKKNNVKINSFNLTNDELNDIISDYVIDRVNLVLDTYLNITDLKTIYIAFDGVPSKGKLIEQKKRIYTKAIDSYFHEHIYDKHKQSLTDDEIQYHDSKVKWEKFNIKPGTEFMKLLSTKLRNKKFMKELKRRARRLSKYIVSDSYHIGEGENKFMDYIRQHLFPNDNYVIFGPDSDLVLLTMLLNVKNINILRYHQQKSLFEVIDIAKMKYNLHNFVNGKVKCKQENVINDFVFLFNIFGNDFVPKIESYPIKHTLDRILHTYVDVVKTTSSYLIKHNNKQYTINFFFFYKLAKTLSKGEINVFYKSNKNIQRIPRDKLSPYQQELFDFNNMQGKYARKLNKQPYFKNKNNIANYYHKYFNINTLDDRYNNKEFDSIVQHYMEGLVWVLDYYFHVFDGISWWYYRHEKAPLFQDIAYFLRKIKDPEIYFNKLSKQIKTKYAVSNYFKPEEQLIYLATANNEDNIILPQEYRDYINKHNVDLNPILHQLWTRNDNHNIIDCSGAIYLSKCHLKTIKDDNTKEYLQKLRQDVVVKEVDGYYSFKF